MVDVISGDLSTTSVMGVDDTVYGTLEPGGDTDLYKVTLSAGNYHINLVGDPIFGSALSDPVLHVYNSVGALLAVDDDDGTGSNSYLDFTASTSGTYYISAAPYSTQTGDYALSVYSDVAATYQIEPGQSLTGRADAPFEEDDYAVFLYEGQTYTFTLESQPGVNGPNSDPIAPLDDKRLQLRDRNLAFLDDDRGTGTATITYTVPAGQTGSYDLRVFGNNQWDSGHYSLSVAQNGGGPQNHRPSGTDATVTVAEDGSSGFGMSVFGYADSDGDGFSRVIITSLPVVGSLTVGGVPVKVNQSISTYQALGTLRWTAPSNANGSAVASFTFEVVDSGSREAADATPNTITFNVTPVNDAPVITSSGGAAAIQLDMNENSAAVTTILASDVDSTPTYGVIGVDAGAFDINASTGALSFRSAADFEASQDAGHDNVYNVTVVATDGSLTDTQNLTIVLHNIAGNTIFGTKKGDTVDATHGLASKTATTEEDYINGKKGDDKLNGLAGNDTLIGGVGEDTLIGGAGFDRLDGGKSADQFVFATKSGAGVDTIVKFEHDKDEIALGHKAFKAIGSSLSDSEFYSKAGAIAAHNKSQHLIYNETTGDLYYDKDGKGGAVAVLVATLSNHPGNLDHHDFLII